MSSRNICVSVVRAELALPRRPCNEYWVSLIEARLKELMHAIGCGYCCNRNVRDCPCCQEQVDDAQLLAYECLRLISNKKPAFHIIKSNLAYMSVFLIDLGCMFCFEDVITYSLNIREHIIDLNFMLTDAMKIHSP